MTRTTCLALVVALGSTASCRPAPEAPAPSYAPAIHAAAAQTAVGPVPGPADTATGPRNPYQGVRGAIAEGRDLFVRFNCSGCHGGRAGGGMGPSLRDVDWIYGRTDAQIFSSIAQGRAHGMPAWGVMVTEDQIWKLVTYVESLRTPDEPHPPDQ